MKYLKLAVFLLLISSCKTKTNAEKIVEKTTVQELSETSEKKTLQEYTFPNYFNQTSHLGLGLLKSKSDTLKYNNGMIDFVYKPKSIIPIFFKPDYGIFYIVCVNENDSRYKILSSNNKEFIVNKEDYDFKTWKDFLIETTTGVDNLNWEKNPLKEKPSFDSKNKIIKNKENLIVKDFKGNWVLVESEDSKENGWIKWKEDEKLLIDIYLLM